MIAQVGFRWSGIFALLTLSMLFAAPVRLLTGLGVSVPLLLFLSVAGLVWAAVMFVVRDGGYATPANMTFLAIAVLVFFPVAFLGIRGGLGPEEGRPVLSLMAASTAIGLAMPGRGRSALPFTGPKAKIRDRHTTILFFATALGGLSWLVFASGVVFAPAGGSGMISAGLLFTVVAVSQTAARRRGFAMCGVVGGGLAFAIWYLEMFTTFGRINVAAIATAILAIWLMWFPSRIMKSLAVSTIPLALTWAAMVRGAGTPQAAWQDAAGLGSVLHPTIVFGKITRETERLQLTGVDWLNQIGGSVLFWVPRTWWPSKPEGIGRLLVYDLWPHLAHSPHSVSASWVGEGFAFLGPWGVLIASLLFIAVARVVDHTFWRSAIQSRLFVFGGATWAGAQLISYLWGGTFTYISRVGFVVVPLLALGAFAHMGRRFVSSWKKEDTSFTSEIPRWNGSEDSSVVGSGAEVPFSESGRA